MLHGSRHSSAYPLILILAFLAVPLAAQPSASVPEAVAKMHAAAEMHGSELQIVTSPSTGLVVFLATADGIPVESPSGKALAAAKAPERALAFLDTYGGAFGVVGRKEFAVVRVSAPDAVGMEHVRLRQSHRGIPITGGELVVHLRGSKVMAVNGETLPGLADLAGDDLEPAWSADQAADTVRALLAKYHGVTDAEVLAPRLELLNRGLLEPGPFATRLAWFVEARRTDLRQFVWLDARDGSPLLHFSQLPHALSRQVYDAASGSTLPGVLARAEGGPASGDTDVDAAYDFSGDTFDYFFGEHGRDSYDDAGAPLISTTDFCPPPEDGDCPFLNAFWNGSQMVYGDGFSAADDVDAHELTHGVTEHSANLFYYMQSGALNESFSDVFGETVDLLNGAGTDTVGVRWQMGEDIPGFGAIRDLRTPTDFGDPGKLSDAQLACGDPGLDKGGVHSNSGVPNHAYSLAVDGGSYNGHAVSGIGLTRAGKIWYRALTEYLTQASGFLDAYLAIAQSCQDLVGTSGITSGTCLQVQNALDAVELGDVYPCDPAQQAHFGRCEGVVGDLPFAVFEDDLESGGPTWQVVGAPAPAWFLGSFFATSGSFHMWGQNLATVSDSSVFFGAPIALPADAYLYFRHSYGFENSGTNYFDGGVVEFSIDGGSTWADAGGLFESGAAYGGVVTNAFGNALGGRNAFVGDSYGYTTTRLDLSGLAGEDVQFRWRVASDNLFDDYGWFIDDVSIHVCQDVLFADDFETGDADVWSSRVP